MENALVISLTGEVVVDGHKVRENVRGAVARAEKTAGLRLRKLEAARLAIVEGISD